MSGNNPTALTPRLLDTLRSQPGMPGDMWYAVVATTLCVLNRPEDIQAVYKHAVAADPGAGTAGTVADHARQLRIARRLREALLKTSAIGGLPKTINALQELKKAVPPGCLDEPHGGSPTNRRRDVYDTPAPDVLRRGRRFFDGCYGKVAPRVMTSLDHCGTEDLGLAVRLAYGYLLSTTSVLSEAETSFVMIAGLVPQDVNPQLKGHLRGALNGGASVEQVRAVRQVSIQVCRASGMRLLTADDPPGCWGWRAEVQDL
ncbi:carboxymuconolactone decarboxylase [Diaporthe eres]|uniref:Carboxymuconolactone decarboxylase n=1 Tax=Diaporthe vaccinii TaxID=105482 RepID=A0ABR4EGS6_9PEZI|nr:carboxymuconolactone decarboxylase [Diaporthe eres]